MIAKCASISIDGTRVILPVTSPCNKVIQYYDCTIICGHRGNVAQMLAFENGKSELQWPNSNHNELPGKAVDVMAYPINWFDYQRSAHFAGFAIGIAENMGIQLRWGGD
nr:hypothetical protein [Endozoicomonas sp.]